MSHGQLFTVQWSVYKPPGLTLKTLPSVHRVYLFVPYDPTLSYRRSPIRLANGSTLFTVKHTGIYDAYLF